MGFLRGCLRRAWLAACLGAPAVAQVPSCHDLSALTRAGNDYVAQFGAQGGLSLQVAQAGTVVYQQAFGGFTLQQVVPIMSASKTLAAVVLLALDDEGVLDLDDRVGQYLPEWNQGALAAITLRQCFTHTSGMADIDPAIAVIGGTLRAAAQQLAAVPLVHPPGAAFRYGQLSIQVAAAACEVASGRTWQQLFQQKVAGPLQLAATDFYAFGYTLNPAVAFSARTTLQDYGRFLEMLRLRGQNPLGGPAVLSAAMVDAMLTPQGVGLPVLQTPNLAGAPYGIGIWIDRRDSQGRTTLCSASGFYGFVGWVDFAKASHGVFMTVNTNGYPQAVPYVDRCWAACSEALLPAGVACYGTATPVCRQAAWLNANHPARVGTADFEIIATRADANGLGGLLFGPEVASPLVFFDMECWIGLSTALFVPTITDGQGALRFALPLTTAPVGITFAVQGTWPVNDPCAAIGFQASHPLRLTTLP